MNKEKCCECYIKQKILWYSSSLQSARVWDIVQCGFDGEDSKPLHIIHNAHDDWVTDCSWSNTADFIVTASNDFNLKGKKTILEN
jgi:telomerase protein component 1